MDKFTRKSAKRMARLQRSVNAKGTGAIVSLNPLMSKTSTKPDDSIKSSDIDDSIVQDDGQHDRLNLNAAGSTEQRVLHQKDSRFSKNSVGVDQRSLCGKRCDRRGI